MNTTKIKEKTGQTIFTVAAVICVIAVAAIFVFMLIKSIPALNKIGLFDFIFGDNWSPDRLDKYENATLSGSYGILKMIVGTLAATVGALLIGGTLGYFTAVFIAYNYEEYSHFRVIRRFKAALPCWKRGFYFEISGFAVRWHGG